MTAYSTPTRNRTSYLPGQPRKDPDAERNFQTTPKSNTISTVSHNHPKPAVIFNKDGIETIASDKILANRTKRLANDSEVNFRPSQNPLDEDIPASTISTESNVLTETAVTVTSTIPGIAQPVSSISTVTLDPASVSISSAPQSTPNGAASLFRGPVTPVTLDNQLQL